MIIILAMTGLMFLNYDSIFTLMSIDFLSSFGLLFKLSLYFVLTVLLIIIIFALIDFYFIKYYYIKKLMMSFEEIKKEQKDLTVDPAIRARIRQAQEKMSKEGLDLAKLKKANVVITNPTHYAVGVYYEQGTSTSPIIVAKGVDALAQRIRQLALEYNIPIVENPPLARALFEQLSVDQEIPQEFFNLLGEIFREVSRVKGNN